MWFRPSSACKTTRNHSPAEIDRVRGRLGSMTTTRNSPSKPYPRHRQQNHAYPISTLKTAAATRIDTVIELVRRLFNLHDEAKEAARSQPRAGDKLMARLRIGSAAHNLPSGRPITSPTCCAQGHTVELEIIKTTAIKSLTCSCKSHKACSPRRSKRRCSKTALT